MILAILLSALAWPQFGGDASHSGTSPVVAQAPAAVLADFVFDPFAPLERNEEGDLQNHYASPLVDGDDVYMAVKSGTFTPAPRWESQTWGITKQRLTPHGLAAQWTTTTDWKPVPGGAAIDGGPQLEPIFQPVLANDGVYLPAANGAVVKLARDDGRLLQRVAPFGSANVFVSGPLVADANGSVLYNAIELDAIHPWTFDAADAWLVRVAPGGAIQKVNYRTIVTNAPDATALCRATFGFTELPWPPSPTAVPGSTRCGKQRPGVNVAPAIASDGTIYTVSRAHLNSRWSYVVALNGDLTPKWSTSMRDLLNDGCNVALPPNGTPGGCREGALTGVDPEDNTRGAGRVIDDSSSSPVVAPDGSVIYGAFTRYNYDQGHLMHFSASGAFLAAYPFGWDITPAVRAHDGTYSIVSKENHYDERGSYCDQPLYCPSERDEEDEGYFITQLDASMQREWRFRNTSGDYDEGEEWCVNAPAIDRDGVVYVNSEDGFLYAIEPNGSLRTKLFLKQNGGGAYTPLAIDAAGRVYAENGGHLLIVGGGRRRVARR